MNISEGDRGQILIQKKIKKPIKGDNAAQKMGENPDPEGTIAAGEKLGKKFLKHKVSDVKEESSLFSLVKDLNQFKSSTPVTEEQAAIHTYKDRPHAKAMKSRATVYNSITDALRNGYVGQIFSTDGSDRLYVITVQKWGKDMEQIINGRSAKAFYSYKDAKKFAVRTMIRHAGEKSRDLKKKYFGKDSKKAQS
jgi:hypothetical protein